MSREGFGEEERKNNQNGSVIMWLFHSVLTDGMELPNQDKIRTLGEKETFKYLGILEADTIKQEEMKEKVKNEYLRRTRKPLETKL